MQAEAKTIFFILLGSDFISPQRKRPLIAFVLISVCGLIDTKPTTMAGASTLTDYLARWSAEPAA